MLVNDTRKFELNKIYCVDNVEGMKKYLPDESIDLTITSPPYDNLRIYNGYTWDFEGVAKQLFRATKIGGVVVWVVNDATIKGSETLSSFKQAIYFKEIGFNVHDTMIYEKNNFVPLSHNRYEQCFEYMFIFSKGKPIVFNGIRIESKTSGTSRFRGNYKQYESSYSCRKRYERTIVKKTKLEKNIWCLSCGGSNNDDKTKHNAPFPEKLAENHILSWSNEGDVVLDPFFGSGTTGKMAKKNNRNYIGFEISQEYCDISEERLRLTN